MLVFRLARNNVRVAIDTSNIVALEEGIDGGCFIRLDPRLHASVGTYLHVTDNFTDILRAWPKGCEILHVTSPR